jgi:hypothetical protein
MAVPVEQITEQRLAQWSKRLSESHATPIMLVGMGHDHVSGRVVICTLDEKEMTNHALAAILRHAIKELE